MIIGVGAQIGLEEALKCDNLQYCFHFTVDINGDKLPNRWGIDTFTFHVSSDKIIPRGGKDTHGRQTMCDPSASSTSTGWYNGSGCAAWVIQMENLDYLKCVKGNQKYCNKDYYFN